MLSITPNTLVAGRYHISSELGSGGMGTVYRATDLELNRSVAIKMLHKSRISLTAPPHTIERFKREGKALSVLKTEHVVDVYRTDVWEGVPFLVMELVEGTNLRLLLQETKQLPWPHAVRLALQACEGLAAAHAAGIIHRDIKPDNLLIAGSESEQLLKITDFGLCRINQAEESNAKVTASGNLIGSLHYMAPEIATGNYGYSADIYSLGCVLYEMLTGTPPFTGENAPAVLWQHCNEQPQRLNERISGRDFPGDLRPTTAQLKAGLLSIYSTGPGTTVAFVAHQNKPSVVNGMSARLYAIFSVAAVIAACAFTPLWLSSCSGQKFIISYCASLLKDEQVLSIVRSELQRVKQQDEFADFCDHCLNYSPKTLAPKSRISLFLELHRAATNLKDRDRAQRTAILAFQELARFLARERDQQKVPNDIQQEFEEVTNYLTSCGLRNQTWRKVRDLCLLFLRPETGKHDTLAPTSFCCGSYKFYARAVTNGMEGAPIADFRQAGFALEQCAYALESLDNWKEASEYFNSSIDEFEKKNSPEQFRVAEYYAEKLIVRHDFNSLVILQSRMIEALNKLDWSPDPPVYVVRFLEQVSSFSFGTGRYESVVAILVPNLARLENIALKKPDCREVYTACCARLALSLHRQGKYEEARFVADRLTRFESQYDCWNHALSVSSSIMEPRRFREFYDNYADKSSDISLAWSLDCAGMPNDSLDYCNKVTAEKSADSSPLAQLQCSQALLYSSCTLYKRSEVINDQLTALSYLWTAWDSLYKTGADLDVDPSFILQVDKSLSGLSEELQKAPIVIALGEALDRAVDQRLRAHRSKDASVLHFSLPKQWEQYNTLTDRLPDPILKRSSLSANGLEHAHQLLQGRHLSAADRVLESWYQSHSFFVPQTSHVFMQCLHMMVGEQVTTPQSYRLALCEKWCIRALRATVNDPIVQFQLLCFRAFAYSNSDTKRSEAILLQAENLAAVLHYRNTAENLEQVYLMLAAAYQAKKFPADACRISNKIIVEEKRVHREDSMRTVSARATLGDALLQQGKLSEAYNELKTAVVLGLRYKNVSCFSNVAGLTNVKENLMLLSRKLRSIRQNNSAQSCDELLKELQKLAVSSKNSE